MVWICTKSLECKIHIFFTLILGFGDQVLNTFINIYVENGSK